MRVGLVIFDDFTDLDFFLPWDLLNRPRLLGLNADFEVEIVGHGSSHRSKAGLPVSTTRAPEDCAGMDAVLFASGPETRKLAYDKAWLNRFLLNPERQLVGAMDSGALILAALGLLHGKSATTYPTARKALGEFGVQVIQRSLVIEENVATAAACLAGTHLSGWVLARLLGASLAQKVLDSVALLREEGPTEGETEHPARFVR